MPRTIKRAVRKVDSKRSAHAQVDGLRRLKKMTGPGLVILGSGSIVALMTDAKLIDVYDVVINRIVLGSGKPLFDHVKRLPLKLRKTRAFKNGNVVLSDEL
jgi:dihydrofolate reductase